MLSSIHPLGERSRQNRWVATIGAFAVGALTAGATVGYLGGALGSLIFDDMSQLAAIAWMAGATAVAATLDLTKVRPPGPGRQVNENWIRAFRGWIYGGGFGLQLGVGVATYVVTWGVYAMFVTFLLLGSPIEAALVGAVFGLGRTVALLAAITIDRPSRLTSFNRYLARIGPAVRVGSGLAFALLAVVSIGWELA